MTTRPDAQMIKDLHDRFLPNAIGVINTAEEAQVMAALEITDRTDIELQNCRDMAVMMYAQWAAAAKDNKGNTAWMREMDAMSAVTAVIDKEKARRNMPV